MIDISITKTLKGIRGTLTIQAETEIPAGKVVAIYGPSGAGKTSLLRMIAGLMKPDSGKIIINGITWFNSGEKINLSPQKRKAGFVFQDFALFPNFTVHGNLKYALTSQNQSARIEDLLEKFDLNDLRDEKPNTLSGGQKQRVALARALVSEPNVLLLDEPLSALDYALRRDLQDYISGINREKGTTIFLVSHDIGEIFRIAHQVIKMESGTIVKAGTPAEVFSRKQISGKFRFTGELLSIEKEDVIFVASVLIGSDVIKVVLDPSEAENLKPGDKVLVASKAFNPIIQRID